MRNRILGALTAALVLSCAVFVYGAGSLGTGPLSSGNVSSGGSRYVHYREFNLASVNATTDILPAAFSAQSDASSVYIDVQLATSRVIKLTVAQSGHTTTSLLLNDNTALTAGAHKTLGPIPLVKGASYNLQLVGGASAIDYLVITEAWGTAVGKAGGSGGGSSDPALGGDLSGTASAASVVNLTGTVGVVNGATGSPLTIQASSGNNLALRANAGSGAQIDLNNESGSITLTPSGSGEIKANGRITFQPSLGAISHIVGPSDHGLVLYGGTGQEVVIQSDGSAGSYADFLTGANAGISLVTQGTGAVTLNGGGTGRLKLGPDTRLYNSTTKTVTLDDSAGGAATLAVTGAIEVPTLQKTTGESPLTVTSNANLILQSGASNYLRLEPGTGGVSIGNADDVRLRRTATSTLTLDADGAGGAAHLTVPGAGSDSEVIGAGATGVGQRTTVHGKNSTASGLGGSTYGYNSVNDGVGSTMLGAAGNVTHNNVVALGYGATSTQANQCVIGSSGNPVDQIRVETSTGAKIVGSDYWFKVSKNGTQSISDLTTTQLTTWTETSDGSGIFASDQFTVPTGGAGIWHLEATVRFAANATGIRQAAFFVNGVSDARTAVGVATAASGTNYMLSLDFDLSDGDVVTLRVLQNSGGNLNVDTGTNGTQWTGRRVGKKVAMLNVIDLRDVFRRERATAQMAA